MQNKKARPLKDLFSRFPNRTTLDDIHNADWNFKGLRKRLEKYYLKLFGATPDQTIYKPVIIKWSEKGRGFGEYVFWVKNGVVFCHSEMDSPESVKRVLSTLVDQAVFVDFLPKKERRKADTYPRTKSGK